MLLSDLHSKSTLVTQIKPIIKRRFPLIDAHNHLAESEILDLGTDVAPEKIVAVVKEFSPDIVPYPPC